MALTNAARDKLLTGGLSGTISHLGLAGPTGTELSGGSPAYARKAVTWTATAGTGIVDNTAALTFDVGGSTGTPVTVARVLLRAALSGGTDYGWFPVGGVTPFVATVDSGTDAFTSFAHGLPDGTNVYLEPVSGASLVTGVSQGTLYYTRNTSTNAFQVGVALTNPNITSSGEVWVLPCVPETFNSQGTYQFAIGDVDLYGLLL